MGGGVINVHSADWINPEHLAPQMSDESKVVACLVELYPLSCSVYTRWHREGVQSSQGVIGLDCSGLFEELRAVLQRA
eukprot:1065338-Rhodomonas_salina.5